ncbi:M16 family metallopeptidase [Legionella micdadei]|uniref:Zinc protease n=1 Tax=Legionella micdadei TaxID=451 RepID=A0A098GHS3_LEGMI|nr:pitrilysin family protein [Legionella micdadei]ARG96613.1 peptidase M16 [Legionella micdadei]ARG99361.1 peptidase M16 [Legionella micdadei]KTD29355.1 zinc protease [Legionella micdadei]NSL18902.1 insulinase family protein [Legionella micdadei]CEG62019.1 Zinc protease (Peptidase, M16 family) [Legionella micdadei]
MRILLLILLAALSCESFSQVKEFTLDNGLKVLVKEDHRAPIAVSMVWYNVGSADEPGGITGISHALEHIMFKGTEKYPLGIFSRTIAAVGGQENAFTNYDYTAYFEKIAANQLPISFELEADRMQNLLLDEAEFAKEIKVIREERRLRTDDNPQALAFERYLAAAHLTAPYHHPIIGWMSDLHQMTIQDVKSWYRRFYAPNNATLVVVGDVNPDEVYQLAKQHFGQISKQTHYERKPQVEPPPLGPKAVEIYAPAQLPLIMFGYPVPSTKTAKTAWEPYALEVIASILSAGESARFAKNLIRGTHVASDANTYYNLYTRYPTQFIFLGTPSQSHTPEQVKAAMLKEIKQLQTELIKPAELQRIKTQIIAQKTFEKDSIFGQAMEIGLLETIGLGWKASDNYTSFIHSITPEQIQQVAQRYFNDNAITEARLIPLSPEEQE